MNRIEKIFIFISRGVITSLIGYLVIRFLSPDVALSLIPGWNTTVNSKELANIKKISMIDLIGVYEVEGHPEVHLIEMIIKSSHDEIDIGEFTQKQDEIDRLSWQSPWDEKYLDETGFKVIGDWMNPPNESVNTTRIAFSFHFLVFEKPMITPFGNVFFEEPKDMPDRLSNIITYESPD